MGHSSLSVLLSNTGDNSTRFTFELAELDFRDRYVPDHNVGGDVGGLRYDALREQILEL